MTTNNSIVPHQQATGMTLAELGQTLARSGYFADTREASQAIVKVLAGREMGFGPVASMTGVYIVKGRVALSANLMAAAIKRSGRYDFRVRELSEKIASIEFFENAGGKRESLGVSTFTIEDARRAGTQNLDRFPKNMLYARAMSNGVKWYCPDAMSGPIYTPDELGEAVNEDGEIIDARPAPTMASPAAQASATTHAAPEPKVGQFDWSARAAALRPMTEDGEAIRELYAELLTINTERSGGVNPYPTKPASLAEAIARCKDMAKAAELSILEN